MSCPKCEGLPASTPGGHVYLSNDGSPKLGGRIYIHSRTCPCGEGDRLAIVLREDCATCAAWREAGCPVERVEVGISGLANARVTFERTP